MIKQREESVELYDKGGRPELADQERAEIEIIASYLPKQMSDPDDGGDRRRVAEIVRGVLEGHGHRDRRAQGHFAGTMDFCKASGLVKGKLSGG